MAQYVPLLTSTTWDAFLVMAAMNWEMRSNPHSKLFRVAAQALHAEEDFLQIVSGLISDPPLAKQNTSRALRTIWTAH
jgi:hypothetical protein